MKKYGNYEHPPPNAKRRLKKMITKYIPGEKFFGIYIVTYKILKL